MNLDDNKTKRLALWLWGVAVAAALVAWPAGSHWAWRDFRWPLHGLPAFFLGLLALAGLAFLVKCVRGFRRRGFAWAVSREALAGLLLTAVLGASLVALYYAVEFWRGRHAWAAAAAEAARRHQSLDPGQVAAATPRPEQDFARIRLLEPLAGTAELKRDSSGNLVRPGLGSLTNMLHVADRLNRRWAGIRLAQWLEGESTDLPAWAGALAANAAPRARALETNRQAAAAAVLRALEPIESMFEELRAGSSRPSCRLPFDHAFPYFSEPHAERVMLSFARLLRARATAELELNRNEAALEDSWLALRLMDYLRMNPTLYYQSARAYTFADSLQPVWEGMVQRRWTAAQLARLQRQFQGFAPLADYAAQARFVTLANKSFIESIIPTAPLSQDAADRLAPDGRQALRWVRRVYPVGWSLQDQAAVCRFGLAQQDALPEALARPFTSARERQMAGRLLRGTSDPFFPVFVVPRVVALFSDLQEHLPFAQTAARLAELACALERHRIERGDYPASLEALAPAFVAQVPSDPMSGVSFRFQQTPGQGCGLHSIGSNGVDDHGQPCPRPRSTEGGWGLELDLREGDWVWRLPAAGEAGLSR